MPRSVFVHETIDIVGQGQYDYMEMVNREPAQHMPDMTSLQGTFYVLGFGGGVGPKSSTSGTVVKMVGMVGDVTSTD